MSLPYTFKADRAAIDERRDHPVYEQDSGLAAAALREKCLSIEAEGGTRPIIKARQLAYILEQARLEVSPLDLFADRIDGSWILASLRNEWRKLYGERIGALLDETAVGDKCGAYSGDDDFGHTCPDWQFMIRLGVPGIIARLEAELAAAPEEKKEFYSSCLIAWRGFRRLLERFAEAYARHDTPTAKLTAANFRALSEHEPQNLMQVLQLIAVYYRTQNSVECEPVRALGRLDLQIAPFMSENRAENEEILRYFLNRMNDIFNVNNIPFTLGGADIESDARCMDTALTILDIFGELDNPSPKIQLRISKNTPAALLSKACRLIRSGSNSIVLCNDDAVVASLIKNGHSPEDAMNYVMIGCYESSAMGREVACTCNGRVILPKAVECALNGGRDLRDGTQLGPVCPEDFADFDAFFSEVKRQAAYFAEQSMRRTTAMEALYPEVCPSPLFSGAMECCHDSGTDVYRGGVVYNFSSVNIFGVATAADSLAAIRKLVYEDRKMSLHALREVLKNNWEGSEKLRLAIKNRFPKYGNGDAAVDSLARELMSSTAGVVNGRPNGRGGQFRAGAFSIDWRLGYGKKCAASADGRFAGESLSKNMCASDCADKNGVTALIESACCFDYTELSNGTVLDMVLHSSAVMGEDGLAAMEGLVRTFQRKGGLALQINVLDPSVLRRAQEEPEKYANLQVRLCGWNVLFVNLTKNEQDEFIRWSEN